MKKKIIALLLTIVFLLVAFAACADGKELTSVELSKQPNKTTYKIGETFNPDGAKLVATYSDKSTKEIDVTKQMCSNADTSSAGKKEVTVNYTEEEITKTATFEITVVGAQVEGQSIELVGADKNMISVKFRLSDDLALDEWDVAEGTMEQQWAEITGLYGAIVNGTQEQATQAAKKIGSDVFAAFYGVTDANEKILLKKTENGNPVIKNKGWSGWLNTSAQDHWYPNGEDANYVGATIPSDTEFQTSISGLDSYYNWAEIKESGTIFCDLYVVQSGQISKVTLSAKF